MKWLDAALGRTRLPRANLDAFFALTTAQATLQAELGLQAAGKAGVCFKPVTSSDYRATEITARELVGLAVQEFNSEITEQDDTYGYKWYVFTDPQFEDLASLVHLVSKTFMDEAYSEQLLTAVFKFWEPEGRTLYLAYNYKRGSFYPFAPIGDRARDNALEIRLSSLMARELPLEKEPGRWYPIWDCPV
ncbi:MAG: hypothetical protein AB1815_05435 [Bacillota bacterium]|jgi:hypothetical protein